ncbi:hypothetical protein [Thermofilum pendens]|uniref:RRN7-type domain-containing protein n=1 Tax=Thermofilum pendens (strain DSM 2475 / Hrk 5) TaxID=368408 RepID=A1S1B4_THEPD|nr:hypothetical protein [Thermofilum pendens]ABL79244.1 hypothetical protein Tpen_1849 [Thermofilum pendens Hrk 5]
MARYKSARVGERGEPKPRCCVCGSEDVCAKIEGKFYCYKCGSRIIVEHSRRIVEELVAKYLGEKLLTQDDPFNWGGG